MGHDEKKGLTTVVYKGLMKSHSKYRDKLTEALEAENDTSELKHSKNLNASMLSSQMLQPDEQDLDDPDEQLEVQLSLAERANKNIAKIYDAVAPFIHDIKTGNLKRVGKSTFVKPLEIDESLDSDNGSDDKM